MAAEIESVARDIGTEPGAVWTRWKRELESAEKHDSTWRERAEKIVKRYRDEDRDRTRYDEGGGGSRFAILYANTEVLRGVLYARTPVPDVRRRFLDKDPDARIAAQLLQRALSFASEAYDFDAVMRACVEDKLLPGRGVAKVKYTPTMAQVPVADPLTGQPQIGADGLPVTAEQVVYEEVSCDYVEWDMVRFSPAKRWEKVRWVAFAELLTREDLIGQFGEEKGRQCALDWTPRDRAEEPEGGDLFKRALVWSIWDKPSRSVKVWAKGFPAGLLAELPDPLRLEQFFPCPKPLVSISTSCSMLPVPLFVEYQDQAIELDNITARIDILVDALRRRGVYDASYPELSKIANAGDNEFIPIENFANLQEKGGIAAALFESPIDVIAKVLLGLYEQRERCKQIIYEVTGIADIVRGATRANETLGAQEMKARYANSRIGPAQTDVANFARDIMRLQAEIIAERFSPQVLTMMTGLQPTERAMQILRSDKLRGFKVDVETDSTIQPDAAEEQKNRIDFISAVSAFMERAAPAVASGAMPMEVAKELLSFGARGFKVSPQLEDALDRLGGDGTPPGELTGPNPQQVREQQAQQAQEMQAQIAAQMKQLEAAQQAMRDESVALQVQKANAGADAAKLRADLDKRAYDVKMQEDMLQMQKQLAAQVKALDEVRANIERERAEEKAEQVNADMERTNAANAEMRGEMSQAHAADRQAMVDHMAAMHQSMLQALDQMTGTLARPRKLRPVRDQTTGRARLANARGTGE